MLVTIRAAPVRVSGPRCQGLSPSGIRGCSINGGAVVLEREVLTDSKEVRVGWLLIDLGRDGGCLFADCGSADTAKGVGVWEVGEGPVVYSG
jgi:hypothetical protein